MLNAKYMYMDYFKIRKEDWHKLCRFCLKVFEDDLITLSVDSNMGLIEEVKFTTSIRITQDDRLPNHICHSCKNEIEVFYNFKKKCLVSNSLLISISQSANKKFEPINRIKYEDAGSTPKVIEELYSPCDNKKYSCNTCSKTFTDDQQFSAHIGNCINNSGYKCKIKKCQETFESEHDFQIHLWLHSKDKKCYKCEKVFKLKSQLRRHLMRHMEHKLHPCDICSRTFVDKFALVRHQRSHGLPSAGDLTYYECAHCGKRFREKYALGVHLAQHGSARPYACERCGRAFLNQRLLRSHRLVHGDTKPYPCSHCGRLFRHKSSLVTHQRTHTGERPYVCAVCGRRFIQSTNLTRHMRIHAVIKNLYPCEMCERTFSCTSSLKRHYTVVHIAEKTYSCKICDKKFHQHTYIEHMKRHSGVKPHQCDLCHKSFFTSWSLKMHSTVHTGEKRLNCDFCEYKCNTRCALKKHMNVHKLQENVEESIDQPLIKIEKLDSEIPELVSLN